MSEANNTTRPSTMKAQVLEAYNTPYAFRDVSLPALSSSYDALIKVNAASYCHTDAVLASGQMSSVNPSFPLIGCHEFAGTVVKLSPEAPSTTVNGQQIKVGDRVGVPGRSFHACGSCFECSNTSAPDSDPAGYSVYCPKSQNLGLTANGGFGEYAVVDIRQVAPIPDGMSAVDTAPLMCAGLTVYAALKKCKLRRGQRVGILGCGGGLGHLGIQFADKMGLEVVGTDTAEEPLELARGLGTRATLVNAITESAEEVKQQLGAKDDVQDPAQMGCDAILVLPESQKAFDYGMKLLKDHGLCVVVSFPKDGFHLSANDIVFRQISITGSLVGSNKLSREMLEFAAEHDIKAIVHRYSLAHLNELVEQYHRGGGGKLVVDMEMK